MQFGCDYDWMELLVSVQVVDYVVVDVIDLFYILYIFGMIGQLKGIVRDNGGYVVVMYYSMSKVYGIKVGEIYWVVFDVGWVVGYFYIVYVFLIYGCIIVLFEGKFIKILDVGIFWWVIEEYNVKVFFIVLIVFWVIKKEDFEGKLKQQYDIICLCYLFLVGE